MRIIETIVLAVVFLSGAIWLLACLEERPNSIGVVAATMLCCTAMLCWFIRGASPQR